MCFFVQTNHTRKELLFLMFKEINLRNHSSLHKLFYSLRRIVCILLNNLNTFFYKLLESDEMGTFIKKQFVAFAFLIKRNICVKYYLLFENHMHYN